MAMLPVDSEINDAFAALEASVYAALETYSNVHRGSGHHSAVSTRLFEQARGIVLDHLGCGRRSHMVIFGSAGVIDRLAAQLAPEKYRRISSRDIGLSLGVCALAVERREAKKLRPVRTGGGTARLVFADRVIPAAAPDRFEAGTPAIVNVIAFARALQLTWRFGEDAFRIASDSEESARKIMFEDELAQLSETALLEALRSTLIGRGREVPTASGARPFINFDNGASTPAFAPVWNAARRTWRSGAQVQGAVIEEARAICAEVLGAPSSRYNVLFTANTTEAINLVADSLSREFPVAAENAVITTLLEHNSNELPWRRHGAEVIRLGIDDEGFVNPQELETILQEYNDKHTHGARRVRLVAVSGASNVLGVFNDLDTLSQIVHRYGARLLVDGAQLVAHRKVDMAHSGIDYLAFSGHKAYAPFGSGALIAGKDLLRLDDAEFSAIRQAAEENPGGIAALGKALQLLQRIGFERIQAEEQALTSRALRGMAAIPRVRIFGTADPDSPAFAHKGGVIPFDLSGIIPHKVARELAARGGVGVRAGCHCAHLTVKRLMRVPRWAEWLQGIIVRVFYRLELPGVVRVSLGIENSEAEIDAMIQVLNDIARKPGATRHAKAQMAAFADESSRRVFP